MLTLVWVRETDRQTETERDRLTERDRERDRNREREFIMQFSVVV